MKHPLHATPSLLLLDESSRNYRPGAILSGQYCLDPLKPERATAVELSVLWFTEGKADEDLAVHFFERLEPKGGKFIDLRQPRRFSTRLPNSPLSYNGVILKIRWCVRMRVFFGGKELSVEEPFELGHVPAAALPAAPPAPPSTASNASLTGSISLGDTIINSIGPGDDKTAS